MFESNRKRSLQPALSIVYVLGVLGIVASGGGSGGGGGSSGLEYMGNTNPATISETNASRLVSTVLAVEGLTTLTSSAYARPAAMSSEATPSISPVYSAARLSHKMRNAIRAGFNPARLNSSIRGRTDLNETEPCQSGSIRITGVIEDNLSGQLELEFINCREGNETLNGSVIAQIQVFDIALLLPKTATYIFEFLTVSGPGFSVTLDGSIASDLAFATMDEFLDIGKLVGRDNTTGQMVMVINHSSTIFYDDLLNPSTYQLAVDEGLVYDSIEGYVSIETIPTATLNFASVSQSYPDNGQLLLKGQASATITVRPVSDSVSLLDLDLDGNLTIDLTANLPWDDIEAEVSLADGDDDGIHDEWESVNGLDPGNAGDATLNFDIDIFTNIEEYLGGSDPNDAGSIPMSADLSITTAFVGAATAGNPANYELTVNNAGPSVADNVLIKNTLAPGVSFVGAMGSGWNCAGEISAVYCSRNSLATGAAPLITIMVTLPGSPGSITNTVTATSATLDTNQVNNTDTEVTNVM